MITHGTFVDCIVWSAMLGASLGAALGCFRMGRLTGAANGEVLDVTYGVVMFLFLIAAFLVFIHAPFHIG